MHACAQRGTARERGRRNRGRAGRLSRDGENRSGDELHAWRPEQWRGAPAIRHRTQSGEMSLRARRGGEEFPRGLNREVETLEDGIGRHHRLGVLVRLCRSDDSGLRGFLTAKQAGDISHQAMLVRKIARLREPPQHAIDRRLRAVGADPRRQQQPERPLGGTTVAGADSKHQWQFVCHAPPDAPRRDFSATRQTY